uniref:Uncharacterized protein n=1 Tax=Tetraselmis sp. GSL018 TaxID=582737 RepID=A0A061RKY6_9CHLO|mmetsp:Transcript_9550/g.22977  ORF Transcript_9550/g.22977 Transcript_9550/m.22977 type:complete len:180 (-) Transcript_9550:155-694(-)|eukprot:CAMPEP_0177582054 /NCGR_PEP_ID=MMETSP0419_2-20121207/2505_1 /TAXON_ID=582737 /ORGANISM="Tetraselmis sp., Strain GSL018" /LENGTH=179 /DNA_ID=CAMNT_0019071195 /DNA_START=82 /DNA_END=621 /DNA_ORIENTATION=+
MATCLSSATASAPRTCVTAQRSQSKPVARVVRVQAQYTENKGTSAVRQFAAAGLAAGLLLGTAPAQAGVQLVKPEVKKVFQSDGTPKVDVASAETAPAPAPKAAPAPSVAGEGPSVPQIAIPSAIVGLVGLTAAAATLDGEFNEFISEGLLKDSTDYAGYEPALKEGQLPKGKTGRGRK